MDYGGRPVIIGQLGLSSLTLSDWQVRLEVVPAR
jgi:hypothetical protein